MFIRTDLAEPNGGLHGQGALVIVVSEGGGIAIPETPDDPSTSH